MGANKQWPLWFAFAAWRFPSSRNPMTLIAINYFCDILLLASNSSSQRRNINYQINSVVGVSLLLLLLLLLGLSMLLTRFAFAIVHIPFQQALHYLRTAGTS